MKRLISFAAIVALLGGLALVGLSSDEAEAQSRVVIKPFTTLYTVNGAKTADGNWLYTPTSSLRGFYAVMSADSVWTATPDLCTLTVYLESGDSARILGPVWGADPAGIITVNAPNVRVTGFRWGVNVTRGTATFRSARLYITGWY